MRWILRASGHPFPRCPRSHLSFTLPQVLVARVLLCIRVCLVIPGRRRLHLDSAHRRPHAYLNIATTIVAELVFSTLVFTGRASSLRLRESELSGLRISSCDVGHTEPESAEFCRAWSPNFTVHPCSELFTLRLCSKLSSLLALPRLVFPSLTSTCWNNTGLICPLFFWFPSSTLGLSPCQKENYTTSHICEDLAAVIPILSTPGWSRAIQLVARGQFLSKSRVCVD